MKKSIITDDMEFCIICGRPRQAIHHVYYGTALRKISDKHGFVVPLCNDHHTGANGVLLDQKIKQYAQRKYEVAGHSRDEFRKLSCA